MRARLRISLLVLLLFNSWLFWVPHVRAADADKLIRVRMGLAARSTTSMPFFVAKERGFFREEGLDAELIVMQAIQTIQATLGNSTQFASATGSAVSAAARGSFPRARAIWTCSSNACRTTTTSRSAFPISRGS